jgi:phage N-6-adenine-methyltransferase
VIDRDSWRTPIEIFDWAERLVGGFEYDGACTMDNALAVPLWTRTGFVDGDSLSHEWPNDSNIWLNPPYSNIKPWVERALACKSVVAMLVMSPNGEGVYDSLMRQSHEINITGWREGQRYRSGRIGFIGPNGRPVNGNPRGSSLFLINSRFGLGQRTFKQLDEICGRKAA